MSRSLFHPVLYFIAIMATVLSPTHHAFAAVILVPGDQATIQGAIGAAVAGDEIVVSPGVYPEAIDLLGKAITLRSTDPADPAVVAATILDATGLGQVSVVTCATNEGPATIIDGLTITGGTGTVLIFAGGGIYLLNASPTVDHCVIRSNAASNGAGVYTSGGNPTFNNCTIEQNSGGLWGGGVFIDGGTVSFTNCTIRQNQVSSYGAGIINFNAALTLTDCSIMDNCSGSDGSGINRWSGTLTATNTVFSGNIASSDPPCTVAASLSQSAPLGGAVYGGGTFTGCTFDNNSVTTFGSGGGVYGNGTFTDCQFINNEAFQGGGLYGKGTITNCTFSGNTAGEGGGMYLSSSPSGVNTSLTNCTFNGNSASGNGGGALYIPSGSPSITDCLFLENTSTASSFFGSVGGGAIYIGNKHPIIAKCDFVRNIAIAEGGAILIQGSTIPPKSVSFIASCAFHGNTAMRGGAIGNGGFVSVQLNTIMVSCLFSGNTAEEGGAIYNGGQLGGSETNPAITNCSFSTNSAPLGSALFNNAAPNTPLLANCILWNNGTNPILDQGTSTTLATFSDIEGGFPGVNNINADPFFLRNPDPGLDLLWGTPDDDYGDLHLAIGSPAVDTGDATALPADLADLDGDGDIIEAIPFDYDGLDRLVGVAVDMGAYERQVCLADITPFPVGNGLVNIDDLVSLLNAFGPCPTPPSACPADITPPGGNGVVNIDDLVAVLNAFGPCL